MSEKQYSKFNPFRYLNSISNYLWVKHGVEWAWVKIQAILGVLWVILVWASGGEMNIFGKLGMFFVVIWLVFFVLSIITYPFARR